MVRVYLDVCCLNRPFDDQRQERIRLESEAVLLILARCQWQEWQLLGSEVIDFEISRIPDEDRRQKVELLASLAAKKIRASAAIFRRALELETLGLRALDALHVTFAEAGRADVMLTTDDRLLRFARRHSTVLKVRVENPVLWLMEVTQAEAD